MEEQEARWVARIRPVPGSSIDDFLRMSIALAVDVWERHADMLVVASGESQLAEIERRGLALVERMTTLADYLARTRNESGQE
jgi:hypothetical protein